MSVLMHVYLAVCLSILSVCLSVCLSVKGTACATTVDVLKLNTLGGTKTAWSTPKRQDEHSRHFHMGFPPGHHVGAYHVGVWWGWGVVNVKKGTTLTP